MSSRRVAATLGLGRTTALDILKDAGISLRPTGRRYLTSLFTVIPPLHYAAADLELRLPFL